MRLTITYSKIKMRNLVLINNATYQRETLSERPIRQPLSVNKIEVIPNSNWKKKNNNNNNKTKQKQKTVCVCVCVCVCGGGGVGAFGPAFKARTRVNFLHSKWGHFDKARSKFQSSLCDYVHCPYSSIIWV